jgi:predicted nucleic acid-binding Zn ribbon protein
MTIYREYVCRHCRATATEVVRQVVPFGGGPEPRQCHACGAPMAETVTIDGVLR